MNPGAVALVAAFASTCSEVYAYLVGECAAKFMSRRQRFMLKVEFPGHLYVTAFILGATPLPLLDLYLVWAGAVGADEAKLVPAIFLGRLCKMLFFVIVASFISPVI